MTWWGAQRLYLVTITSRHVHQPTAKLFFNIFLCSLTFYQHSCIFPEEKDFALVWLPKQLGRSHNDDGTACNNRFDASVLEMSESRGQYTKPTKKKKLDLWTAAAASLSSRVQSPKTALEITQLYSIKFHWILWGHKVTTNIRTYVAA